MEKKQNLSRSNITTNKGQISESRKSQQDASGAKQWPRNGRRRESFTTNQKTDTPLQNNYSSTKQQYNQQQQQRNSGNNYNNSSSNNNNSNNYNDKRSGGARNNGRNDGYPRSAGSSIAQNSLASATRLDDDNLSIVGNDFHAEMNSIYLPGSKKQNLNHLLNFNYAPRERSDPNHLYTRNGSGGMSMYQRNNAIRKIKYNKEQFLQATCQFVVRTDMNLLQYTNSPDLLVDWNYIEQIHVQTAEEPQCPICLFPPIAGKMTRCGHIYCWPCVLHYLALSDKSWRKCPICYEAIHVGDLKSAISKPHASYNIGDYVNLQLMCREKGTLTVTKVSEGSLNKIAAATINTTPFPHLLGDKDEIMHSKIILANPNEIMTIIERERNELIFQQESDGPDCPESIFIEQSLELLQQRENDILKQLKKHEGKMIKMGSGSSSIETVDAGAVVATAPVTDSELLIEEKLKSMNFVDKNDDELILSPPSPTVVPETPVTPATTINYIIDEESQLTLQDIDITPMINDSRYFYFYQSSDGQHLYLHSLNVRMLQTMYGSLDKAPSMIRGKILQKESCSMSEALRKRLKYLQHLPVTSQFEVVEIGLNETLISDDVLEIFRDELTQRQRLRQKRAKEERKREKHIDEVNERQIGKIMARSANIDVSSNRQFPMCGSYDSSPPSFYNHVDHPPLISASPSTISEVSTSPTVASGSGHSVESNIKLSKQSTAGPSFATMLTKPKTKELWPTLAKPVKTMDKPPPAATAAAVLNVSRSFGRGGDNYRQSESDFDEMFDVSFEMDNDDLDLVDRPPPEYKQSFGNGIELALQKKAMDNFTGVSGGGGGNSNGGGGKKKKNKKYVLFSTGGRSFNGN